MPANRRRRANKTERPVVGRGGTRRGDHVKRTLRTRQQLTAAAAVQRVRPRGWIARSTPSVRSHLRAFISRGAFVTTILRFFSLLFCSTVVVNFFGGNRFELFRIGPLAITEGEYYYY